MSNDDIFSRPTKEKHIELMIMLVEQKLQVFTSSMEIKFKDLEKKWKKKNSENVSKL